MDIFEELKEIEKSMFENCELNSREKEVIFDNLRAFVHNFGKVRIEKYCSSFNVYSPADRDTYVQHCYNLDYLNGWLYGAVQALFVLKPIRND